MFTRRHFVTGIALSSCAVLLTPGSRLREPGGLSNRLGRWLGFARRNPRELTPIDLRPRVGESFSLAPEKGPALEAVLQEVVEYRGGRLEDGRRLEQFSLIFDGPASEEIEQGTFVVSHPDHGEFALFVVPTGPSGKRREYEASFTRLV